MASVNGQGFRPTFMAELQATPVRLAGMAD